MDEKISVSSMTVTSPLTIDGAAAITLTGDVAGNNRAVTATAPVVFAPTGAASQTITLASLMMRGGVTWNAGTTSFTIGSATIMTKPGLMNAGSVLKITERGTLFVNFVLNTAAPTTTIQVDVNCVLNINSNIISTFRGRSLPMG